MIDEFLVYTSINNRRFDTHHGFLVINGVRGSRDGDT